MLKTLQELPSLSRMQFKPHALAYKAPGGLALAALSVLNLDPSSPCFLSSSYTDLLIPVPKHSSF